MEYGLSFKTKININNYFTKEKSKGVSYHNSKGNIRINDKHRIEMQSQSIYHNQSKGYNSNPKFITTQNSPDRQLKKRDTSEVSYDNKKKVPSAKGPLLKPQLKDKLKFDQFFMNKINKIHTKNTQSYHQLTHSNYFLNKSSLEISQQQKTLLNNKKIKNSSQKKEHVYKRFNSTFEDKQDQAHTSKYNVSKGNNSKKNSPRVFSSNGKKEDKKMNITINKNNMIKENTIQSINIKDFQYLKSKNTLKKKTPNHSNTNLHTNNSNSKNKNNKSNYNLNYPYVKYSTLLSKNYYNSQLKTSSGAILLECDHTKSIKNISLDLLGKSINQTKPNSRKQSKEKEANKNKVKSLIQSIGLNNSNYHILSKKIKSSLASTKCSSSSLIKQNDNNRFNNSSFNNFDHLNGFSDIPNAKITFNSNGHQPTSSEFAATSKNFLNINDIQLIETITSNAQNNNPLITLIKKKDTYLKDELICGNVYCIDTKEGSNAKHKSNAKSNSIINGLSLNSNNKKPTSNKITEGNSNSNINNNNNYSNSKLKNKKIYDLNSIINSYHNHSSNKYKSPGVFLNKDTSNNTSNLSPISKSNPTLNDIFNQKFKQKEDKDKDKSNSKDKEEQITLIQVPISNKQNEEKTIKADKKNNNKNSQEEEKTGTITEPMVIDQSINDTQTNHSIQSTIRESSYYQLKMENLANYIRQYRNTKGYYPQSNINFYLYGRVIGKGAFGKVNLALHLLSGRLVAIKSFNKTKIKTAREKDKIQHEIHALKKLQHPYISKILDIFETEKHILICMEYICGDLLTFIRKRSKLSESAAKVIFRQIIEGIQFIHSKKIVHRDIKLDNILIDLNSTVKICDFGVSRKLHSGDIMHEHCGTLAYIAPEILKGKGYEGYSCDIWSAGVTLYYMLSGNQPFNIHNNNDLFKEKVAKGEYEPLTNISCEGRDLIDGMLQVDPKKRLTISEILSHPWLVDVNLKFRNNINLFTNAEKILLKKYDVNYLKSNKEELVENFTMNNLNTVREEEKKYGNTRSLILAPYNSYASSISSLSSVDDIKIENGLCRYRGKVKHSNIKYELNNNADFDNGVIITQYDSNNKNSISINKNNNNNNETISKLISPNNKSNDEINIISGLNSPLCNKKRNEINFDLTEPLTIRENIVREIESNTGYDYSYVINCLKQNEVNYATATYHLLLKDFNDNL